MEDKTRKIAAALSAVTMYLEDERAAQSGGDYVPRFSGAWSGYGRTEIMRMRSLVTLRALRTL